MVLRFYRKGPRAVKGMEEFWLVHPADSQDGWLTVGCDVACEVEANIPYDTYVEFETALLPLEE
jgi:hypothetical protein